MKKVMMVWGLTGILLFNTMALANEGNKSAATLEAVVVSVTQTATPIDDVGGNSISVITSKEIEEKNYHTVEEIIKTVPGVTTVSNGGMGTKSSVFMRGADSKNTLVLIDGIMVNDPSGANRDANLADINLDNVERIEVVRGAMSVMYGSNATAGMINIITKDGKKEPEIYGSFEAGSYGTWKVGGGASGSTDRINYSVSASTLSREGFSVADHDNGSIPHDGNTDEKDGYENLTLAGKLGYRISENFKIHGSVRYVDSEVELDDSAGGYTGDNIMSTWLVDPDSGDFINTQVPNPDGPTRKRSESERIWGQIGSDNSFAGGKIQLLLSYKFSRNDRQSYDNDDEKWYDYKGDTDELSWQGNVKFDNSTLSFGAGYLLETMESQSSFVDETDTHTTSYWIQDQLFWGESLVLIAGARLDDHESFGSKVTFRIAPSYEIIKTGTLLKASFGTGFRSPSLYELYSSYGNPDLGPEESIGWDIGFEQGIIAGKLTLGMTYFRMDFKDRIGYDFLTSRYNQLEGTTETSGLEVFVNWTPLEALSLGLNYTYTHTDDPDGNQLVRRPYNQVGASASWRIFEKAVVSGDLRWVDDRKASPYSMDMNGSTVETLDAYTVVNLSVSYDVCDYFQLFARVDNLFDEYYEEAFSYATPGLSGYLGCKVRW